MFLWGKSIVMHPGTTCKVTESLPISSEVCLHNITCKKETNTGYLRNTGENPELHKWGRGKKIVVEVTIFHLLMRYLRQTYFRYLKHKEIKHSNISESLSSTWGLGLCFQAGLGKGKEKNPTNIANCQQHL